MTRIWIEGVNEDYNAQLAIKTLEDHLKTKNSINDLKIVLNMSEFGFGYKFMHHTPLTLAVKLGRLDLVEELLDKYHCDPNVSCCRFCDRRDGNSHQYYYPLELAIDNNDSKMVDVLLRHSANPDLCGYSEYEDVDLESDAVVKREKIKHDFDTQNNKINVQLDRARSIPHLENYLKNRERDSREYKTSFNFFCHEFHFGFSRTQKLKAARQLLKVLKGEAADNTLTEHLPILMQGELSSVFLTCEKGFPGLNLSHAATNRISYN